jgi:exonuclease III
MKIFSWNTFDHNKNTLKGINYILNQNPDVICLQEIPYKLLSKLEKLSNYYLTKIVDFKGIDNPEKGTYLCILTKNKPISIKTISYYSKQINCLWSSIYYKKLLNQEEQHDAISIELPNNIQITNAHLSAVANETNRTNMLKNLTSNLNPVKTQIICGDFNTSNNIVTRKVRNLVGEKEVNKCEKSPVQLLLQQLHLKNIFEGKFTSNAFAIKEQFDYILVSKDTNIKDYQVESNKFGSDHNIIWVKI